MKSYNYQISNGSITKNLIVEAEAALPLLTMSQGLEDSLLITSRELEVKDSQNTVTGSSLIVNSKSYYASISVSLLQDDTDNNLIMCPMLDLYPLNTYPNRNIDITGYLLGSTKANTGMSNNIVVTPDENLQLPKFNKVESGTLIMLNMPGIASRTDALMKNPADIDNIIYIKTNPMLFLKLKKSDLTSEPLPMHNLIPGSRTRLRLTYAGYVNPEYVYIPLPN